MTEKRFEIMVGGMVWDNHVDEDRQLSRDEVVDLLNALHEENENHKQRISMLSELLDLADAIIDFSDDEKAKEVWENKNEEFEKKWGGYE